MAGQFFNDHHIKLELEFKYVIFSKLLFQNSFKQLSLLQTAMLVSSNLCTHY